MARMASLMALLVLTAGSGCASLGSWNGTKPVADAAAFPAPATIAIEYHPHNGKTKVVDVPFEEGQTIQAALEKTGAHKKFRRSFIDLQRTPKGGMPHKMPIDFKSGQVGHATNYDLHPNDRIIITEDNSTIFDDMASKFIPGMKTRKR